MSFTPNNKANNQSDLITNAKEQNQQVNQETIKINSNFIIDKSRDFERNGNNNKMYYQGINMFDNLKQSEINANNLKNENVPKEFEQKVKFENVINNMNYYMNHYINFGMYLNALFYAEKIFFLCLKKEEEIANFLYPNNNMFNFNTTTTNINGAFNNNIQNPIFQFAEQLFNFANCLYLNKEYFRCINLIQKYNMTYYNIKFLNLLGQALFASEDYESVIANLDKSNIQFFENSYYSGEFNDQFTYISEAGKGKNQPMGINNNYNTNVKNDTAMKNRSNIKNHIYETVPNQNIINKGVFNTENENYYCVSATKKIPIFNPISSNTTKLNCNQNINLNLNGENIIVESEKLNNLYHSVRCLIVAKAHEMQENKEPAIRNYIEALRYDPGNIEAFEAVINHNLYNNEQRAKLTQDLCFDKNNIWLYDYFYSKSMDNILITEKSDCFTELALNNNQFRENSDELKEEIKINLLDVLYRRKDQDLMKIEAEKYFRTRDYYGSYINLKKINDDDFYKLDIIPMYCSCMIELNKVGELYYLAHKLANNCPEKYISWFAVGCYYYCVKKFDIAKKYFCRCTQINKHFPEGLIALGNCYAALDEVDQALSLYRSCLRLFPGCHLANLYVGMEYVRSNNLKTALIAFQEALITSNSDPLVYNEIGVIYYKQKLYEKARECFLEGIRNCKEDKSFVYQSLTINLGHTMRKMREFDAAIYQYNIVIKMDTRNINVLTALAYTYHLKGDYVKALDLYHKVNYMKSDDAFTTEMINKCLNDLIMNNEQNDIFSEN